MSLQVWLPFTDGTLKQQGLSSAIVTSSNYTVNNNGKLGKCIKTKNTTGLDLGYDGNQINTGGISFGGWFKFNKDEIGEVINNARTYNSTYNTPTGQLIGNDSYGGIGIVWNSNNMYTSSPFSSLLICSNIRTSTVNRTTGSYTVVFDTWVHVFVTFNKDTGALTLYINGSKFSETVFSSFSDARSYNLMLNYAGVYGGNGPGLYIPFDCNDIRVYDHCLSPMEVKRISQGLVLHYPLNNMGLGQENFILESHKVISGGQASGITRTYENDGSMKIVASSGNGTWCSLGFAKNSNTNVGNNMTVGDTYCISCDVKVESGTVLPTLFINNGNSYKQLKPVSGSIITNKWMRIYYSSTWADPGTSSYGNISLHLGFNSAIGTYYFKNFKLEKGSIPTPWSPAPSDDLATQMGLNSNIEYDTSGYCNNGTRAGTFSWTSDTPKYSVSTYFEDGSTSYITTPVFMPTDKITTSVWFKGDGSTSGANSYHIPFCIGFGYAEFSVDSAKLYRQGYYINGTRYCETISGAIVNDGKWHMMTATYDGTILCRYLDGQLINSKNISGTLNGGNLTLLIGKYYSGGYNNKKVKQSDIRIYATALSADDVKSLYQNTATIDADGTIHGAVR